MALTVKSIKLYVNWIFKAEILFTYHKIYFLKLWYSGFKYIYHDLILHIFHHPQKKPSTCQAATPPPCLPQPLKPLTCFCYFLFCTLHTSVIMYYMAALCLFLSLSLTCSRLTHIVAGISVSILFYGWIIFHHTDRSHPVYPFISWWTFGLFPLIGYCD